MGGVSRGSEKEAAARQRVKIRRPRLAGEGMFAYCPLGSYEVTGTSLTLLLLR